MVRLLLAHSGSLHSTILIVFNVRSTRVSGLLSYCAAIDRDRPVADLRYVLGIRGQF